MRVKVLETNERLGVKEGEIYSAKRYWLDPQSKVTLLAREPDGYNPECNQYVSEIAIWMHPGEWMVVRNNVFVPEGLNPYHNLPNPHLW